MTSTIQDFVDLGRAAAKKGEDAERARIALYARMTDAGWTPDYARKPKPAVKGTPLSNSQTVIWGNSKMIAAQVVTLRGKRLAGKDLEAFMNEKVAPATVIAGSQKGGRATDAGGKLTSTWNGMVTSLLGSWARGLEQYQADPNAEKDPPKDDAQYCIATAGLLTARMKRTLGKEAPDGSMTNEARAAFMADIGAVCAKYWPKEFSAFIVAPATPAAPAKAAKAAK